MGRKMYGHFKRHTDEILREKTWAWLKEKNLKKKIESLQRAVKKPRLNVKVKIERS